MFLTAFFRNIYTPGHCLLCNNPLYTETGEHTLLCGNCFALLKPITGKRCRTCGTPLISEDITCMRCRNRDFSFSNNYSLFTYDGMIKELLYQYKFNNEKHLSAVFSELIYKYLSINCQDRFTLVPAPSRKSGKRRRGWGHVEIIARILKNHYKVPTLFCLKRKGETTQKTLNYEGRLTNLNGKIYIKKNSIVLPENIIILDDIFTTGATVEQCSKVLRNGGAKEIRSLTLALD